MFSNIALYIYIYVELLHENSHSPSRVFSGTYRIQIRYQNQTNQVENFRLRYLGDFHLPRSGDTKAHFISSIYGNRTWFAILDRLDELQHFIKKRGI